MTIVDRDKAFHEDKEPDLVPPVITMVLYLYIFGSIIGRNKDVARYAVCTVYRARHHRDGVD